MLERRNVAQRSVLVEIAEEIAGAGWNADRFARELGETGLNPREDAQAEAVA